MATDTDTIEYLKFVAEQTEAAAREARKRYNDALRDAAPWKVGDVAIAIRGYGGAKRRPCKILITRASVQWGTRVIYKGKWQNKDGSWGKVESNIYGELHPTDWVPEPVNETPVTKDML